MKIVIPLCLIIISSFVFTACGGTSSPSTTTSTGSSLGAPAADQKSGTTTKTGILSSTNGSYFLQEPSDTPHEVESYVVELDKYIGQTVTVTGQYSGDTLFIGSIE